MTTFMKKNYETLRFIDGILALASLQSTWIGRDDAQAFLFSNEDTLQEFRDYFRIKEEVSWKEEGTFEEAVKEVFGEEGEDGKLSDNVLWLLKRNFGEPLAVYRPVDERKLLDIFDDRKRGPFFFHTLLFFVRFKEFTVCFMTGNFE